MVNERHPRLSQPQRRQEYDPVDHLEHHVGVTSEAPDDRPRRARKYRAAAAHAVHDEVGLDLLDRQAAWIGTRDDRDLVAPSRPPGHVGVDVLSSSSTLRM